MAVDHREPAIVIFKHLIRIVRDQADHGRSGVVFENIKITFGDIAPIVNEQVTGTKYTPLNLRYPLGLVKWAIYCLNQSRGREPIPQINYLVVNSGTRFAPRGAHNSDIDTPQLKQQRIWAWIFGFEWSDDISREVIGQIRSGPILLSKEHGSILHAAGDPQPASSEAISKGARR